MSYHTGVSRYDRFIVVITSISVQSRSLKKAKHICQLHSVVIDYAFNDNAFSFVELVSIDNALSFYERLKSSDEVKIEIKRRGRLQTIEYRLDE